MSSVTTCPRCGAAVPPGASLCPSCAAPLGAAAGVGVPSGHTTEPVLLPGTVPAPGHPGPAVRVPQSAGFAAQTLPGFPTPPPAPAGPVGATEGKRVLAWLIDHLVLAVPAVVVVLLMLPGIEDKGTPLGDGTYQVSVGDITPLYLAVFGIFLVGGLVIVTVEGVTGRTLGKLALGLRTQDVVTGKPIGVGRGIVRGLVFGVSSLACGIGLFVMLLSPLFDKSPRRQGWFDKAARAVVVPVKAPAPRASFVPGGPLPGQAPVPGPTATAGPAAAAYPGPAAYPGAPGAPAAPVAPVPGSAAPAPTPPLPPPRTRSPGAGPRPPRRRWPRQAPRRRWRRTVSSRACPVHRSATLRRPRRRPGQRASRPRSRRPSPPRRPRAPRPPGSRSRSRAARRSSSRVPRCSAATRRCRRRRRDRRPCWSPSPTARSPRRTPSSVSTRRGCGSWTAARPTARPSRRRAPPPCGPPRASGCACPPAPSCASATRSSRSAAVTTASTSRR
nr:RDD family protein [Luteimicrobium album]